MNTILKKISFVLTLGIILFISNPIQGQIIQSYATLDSLSYTYDNTTFSVYLKVISGSWFEINSVQNQNLNDTLKIDLCVKNYLTTQPRLWDTTIHSAMQPNEVPNNLLATIYTDEVGGICANDTTLQPYPYIIDVVLGLNEPEVNGDINIHPNPSKDYVNLRLNENLDVSSISLYDLTGREVNTYKPTDRKLNIRHLSSGQYILKIETNKGIINRKVLIE